MPSRGESQPIRRILIVGGGTAGWITAGVLAARFPERGDDGMSITLVESKGLPPHRCGGGHLADHSRHPATDRRQ